MSEQAKCQESNVDVHIHTGGNREDHTNHKDIDVFDLVDAFYCKDQEIHTEGPLLVMGVADKVENNTADIANDEICYGVNRLSGAVGNAIDRPNSPDQFKHHNYDVDRLSNADALTAVEPENQAEDATNAADELRDCSQISGQMANVGADVPAAIEYYSVKNNTSKNYIIEPIRPHERAWKDLPVSESFKYCNKTFNVGDIVKILIDGGRDESVAQVHEIRSFDADRYFLWIFWFYTKEEARIHGCRNIKVWPRGHSHIKSTHMEVTLWDSTNGKVATQALEKFCPGRVLNMSLKVPLVLEDTDESVTWARTITNSVD